ncbi:MAG: tRNA dihydrouridine synthase DusB [Oscillospiraceae bacterium]|jgi:tRNA-dihydrouridine synthase B|nr:tRNA dihydrouridine synthase DusB [Oscillospiraceae bacterium]
MRIGGLEIPSRLALAPMAGVTDLAFRVICREQGAGLACTEMVSAKALVYRDVKTRALLQTSPAEHPVGAQIFGGDPGSMADGAALALEYSGADFIDINMGCPVGKVVKNGEGSALMLDPDRAMRILEAVKRAVPCPVTVKIRRGFDRGSLNAVPFAQMAEAAGAAAVTVHGRTRAQLYSGAADWLCIRDVKRAVRIPVLANGDVFSGADAARILRDTGADAVMIARGAFGNPWIFREAAAALAGEAPPPRPSLWELADMAARHLTLACETKGERGACLDARRHFAWYLRGVPHAAQWKSRVAKLETLRDVTTLADDIKREADQRRRYTPAYGGGD